MYTVRHGFADVLRKEFGDTGLTQDQTNLLLDRCIEIYEATKSPVGNAPPFRNIILHAFSDLRG